MVGGGTVWAGDAGRTGAPRDPPCPCLFQVRALSAAVLRLLLSEHGICRSVPTY